MTHLDQGSLVAVDVDYGKSILPLQVRQNEPMIVLVFMLCHAARCFTNARGECGDRQFGNRSNIPTRLNPRLVIFLNFSIHHLYKALFFFFYFLFLCLPKQMASELQRALADSGTITRRMKKPVCILNDT